MQRWQVLSTSCKFLKAAQRCCGRFCTDFAYVDGDKGEAVHDYQTHVSLWSSVCSRTETGAMARLDTVACRHADRSPKQFNCESHGVCRVWRHTTPCELCSDHWHRGMQACTASKTNPIIWVTCTSKEKLQCFWLLRRDNQRRTGSS